MSNVEQYEKARKAAYKYLAYRSRTGSQVSDMLFRKRFDEQTVAMVLDNLKEYGLLNDDDFADHYILKKSGRPRAVMASDLRRLGVDEEIIERALAGLDSSAEIRVAMSLALGRRKRLGDSYPMAKMAVFLTRRGFDQEVVERVCNCLENMRHT